MSEEYEKNKLAKLRYDLLPYDALDDVVRGLTFGAKKYGDNSWRSQPPLEIKAALGRHYSKAMQGIAADSESGISHWALVAVRAMMLSHLEMGRRHPDPYVECGEELPKDEDPDLWPHTVTATVKKRSHAMGVIADVKSWSRKPSESFYLSKSYLEDKLDERQGKCKKGCTLRVNDSTGKGAFYGTVTGINEYGFYVSEIVLFDGGM